MNDWLKVDDDESELRLHVPARNNPLTVACASFVCGLSIPYSGHYFYLWLARSERNFSFLYCVLSDALLYTGFLGIRTLLRQLVTRTISFERHVVGVEDRLLGLRLRRRWFSVHRITEWLGTDGSRGRIIVGFRFAKSRSRVTKVEWQMQADQWLNLITRMQRKDFAYV